MIQGFKELTSVCNAISAGRQSVLLRKAGLRESTTESGFHTKSFYLIPTQYHEKGLKNDAPDFSVSLRAEVIRSGDLLDWSQIEKLLPLTAYDPTTIREHFESRPKASPLCPDPIFLFISRLASPPLTCPLRLSLLVRTASPAFRDSRVSRPFN